jgi:hypothetical protein
MSLVFGATITGPSLHINGQQAANGSWFNYNPNATPLYSGAIPTMGSGGYLNIQGFGATTGWATIAYNTNFNTWFVCEFDVKKVAITSVCNSTANITDSTGLIVKKACLVYLGFNHSAGVNYCKSNGMSGLYSIGNAVHFNQVSTFLTSRMIALFGGINTCSLHIDGEKAANGTWFNFNPNPTLLFSGAIPSGTGNFMFIYGTPSGWVTTTTTASGGSIIVCEYDLI